MHDIRYRAWDKQEQCWLDPEHFYITGRGKPYTCQQGRHNISCRYELMSSERYIIERFTGRKDKNGVEIYCGDKLQGLHGQYPVIWNKGRAMFEARIEGFATMRAENWQEREVIGNIHDSRKPRTIKTITEDIS